MTSTRLDQELVARGLVRSRTQAKQTLTDGRVLVDGRIETKPSAKVTADQAIELRGEIDPYVGRAAHKLIAATEAFPAFAAAITGASAIDVGASTGGFTQVLLERGARHVVALDVGHGQLVGELAQDSRVTNLEGVNIRDVRTAEQIAGAPFPIVVSDLSFVSLTLALPHMALLLEHQGHLVALIKPQFEVGRERLGRTGVVSSKEQRKEAVLKVLAKARELGLAPHGLAWSPMVGTHGNHEYLVHLREAEMPGSLTEEAVHQRLPDLLHQEVA